MNADRNAGDRLTQILAGATKIAVLSGAGLSAESGVPTFRGATGLWTNMQGGK